MEHRVVGQCLLAPSTPEILGDPRVRPELMTRLSRLRHEDVHPRAQLPHGGSMPRAAHGMQGSRTTRDPSGVETLWPRFDHAPGDLMAQ